MIKTFRSISGPAKKLLEANGGIAGKDPIHNDWVITFPEGTVASQEDRAGWGNLTVVSYVFPNGRACVWDSESSLLESDGKGA